MYCGLPKRSSSAPKSILKKSKSPEDSKPSQRHIYVSPIPTKIDYCEEAFEDPAQYEPNKAKTYSPEVSKYDLKEDFIFEPQSMTATTTSFTRSMSASEPTYSTSERRNLSLPLNKNVYSEEQSKEIPEFPQVETRSHPIAIKNAEARKNIVDSISYSPNLSISPYDNINLSNYTKTYLKPPQSPSRRSRTPSPEKRRTISPECFKFETDIHSRTNRKSPIEICNYGLPGLARYSSSPSPSRRISREKSIDPYDPNKGYPGFVQHNVNTFEKSTSRSPILYKYMSRVDFPTTCFSASKPPNNNKSPTPQRLTYAGLYKSDSDKSDSPLKTIIRSVYQQQQQHRPRSSSRSRSPVPDAQRAAEATTDVVPPLFNFPLMENFPVVETALYDLQNISLSLQDVLENKSIGAITIIPIVDDGGGGIGGNSNVSATATTIFPVNDVDDNIDFGGVKDIIYTTIHEMPSTLSASLASASAPSSSMLPPTCVGGMNRITEIYDEEDKEGSTHHGREFKTEVLWYWLLLLLLFQLLLISWYR